ncbi:hypothetical protein Tco_1006045 [Tanacetum coccineum]|uniref:Uncharacterized protein n=1 Tax=Tanacetum coccineum TaxID=301880 RepID=A0ABQ5FIY8_9ASTR
MAAWIIEKALEVALAGLKALAPGLLAKAAELLAKAGTKNVGARCYGGMVTIQMDGKRSESMKRGIEEVEHKVEEVARLLKEHAELKVGEAGDNHPDKVDEKN